VEEQDAIRLAQQIRILSSDAARLPAGRNKRGRWVVSRMFTFTRSQPLLQDGSIELTGVVEHELDF